MPDKEPHMFVALLRGINVGGSRPVKMADLKKSIEAAGGTNVRTVVQSGNAVFGHETEPKDAMQLRSLLEKQFKRDLKYEIPVVVRDAASFKAICDGHPFKDETEELKQLHIWFLSKPANHADIAGIERLKADSEQWKLEENAFYLYAPDGIGRSKLAGALERLLGVSATSRNLRTARTLKDLLED